MMTGKITEQQWADWLHVHWLIHQAMDPHLPVYVHRTAALAEDLRVMLPVVSRPSDAAARYAASLVDPVSIFGTAYLTIGAHRRGGQVVDRAMRANGLSYPAGHIVFDDPQAVERYIKTLRDCTDLAPGARRAFETISAIMDEIWERDQ
jgi:hypothetical protein